MYALVYNMSKRAVSVFTFGSAWKVPHLFEKERDIGVGCCLFFSFSNNIYVTYRALSVQGSDNVGLLYDVYTPMQASLLK
jgi:hypothetical protein